MSKHLFTLEDAWKSNQSVILDTETTGLRYPAEPCQIAILDFMGDILIETSIKTKNPIPAEATAIHGISDADVSRSETWPELRFNILSLLKGKHLIIYNAEFDLQILQNADALYGFEFDWRKHVASVHCAMLWYADIRGEWDSYHGNNRWQKLSVACAQQGLPIIDAHDAYGDAVMTYNLISRIMRNRAAETLVNFEVGNPDCEHAVIDDTANGERVCRDCGKTWTV
jgi:DNA polymerase-3 subunit epsilon